MIIGKWLLASFAAVIALYFMGFRGSIVGTFMLAGAAFVGAWLAGKALEIFKRKSQNNL
jgi:hypothetical protein